MFPTTGNKPDGVAALYSVDGFSGFKVILEAVNFEMYLPQQGHLRRMTLDTSSRNSLDEQRNDVKKHLVLGQLKNSFMA